jgi:hypothetical protein
LRPHVLVGAVVRRPNDDRVLRQSRFVEFVQQLPDVIVVFLERVAVDVFMARARLSLRLLLQMQEHVKSRRRMPKEERGLVAGAAIEKVERLRGDFVVERLHALRRQRAFVLRRASGGSRDDSSRIEAPAEFRIRRAIRIFKIFIRVQVVEIAPKLVETVPMGKMFFEIAEVVLAELRRRVSPRFQNLRQCDVLLRRPARRSRRTDRRQSRTNGKLARDDGRPAGRTTRLCVEGRETDAFPCDAIDVRRRNAHDVAAVAGNVAVPDIVPHDEEDVRPILSRRGRGRKNERREQETVQETAHREGTPGGEPRAYEALRRRRMDKDNRPESLVVPSVHGRADVEVRCVDPTSSARRLRIRTSVLH